MDPSVLSAGASAFSTALGFLGQERANRQNKDIWRKTQDFNSMEARLNREWQERMSNTAYQRAIADMKKAGINPLLAVSQGGASSPSGGQGSSSGVSMQNSLSGLPQNLSSAVQIAMMNAQLKNLRSQSDLNDANALSAAQEAILKSNTSNRVIAETARVKAELKRIQSEQPGKDVEAAIDNSTVGKILRWSDRILGTTSSALDVVNPFSRLAKAFKGLGSNYVHTKQGSVYNRRTGEISR